jgi:hypothetical protein
MPQVVILVGAELPTLAQIEGVSGPPLAAAKVAPPVLPPPTTVEMANVVVLALVLLAAPAAEEWVVARRVHAPLVSFEVLSVGKERAASLALVVEPVTLVRFGRCCADADGWRQQRCRWVWPIHRDRRVWGVGRAMAVRAPDLKTGERSIVLVEQYIGALFPWRVHAVEEWLRDVQKRKVAVR